MSQASETTYFERILAPVSRCLTPEVARQLVAVRADPDLQDRLEVLAERSTEGELTPEARAEYEAYVRAMDFVAILQAQAKKLLSNQNVG